MKVQITVELDIKEVNVAYEHDIEIDEVEEFVRETIQERVHVHASNLGWLRERAYA